MKSIMGSSAKWRLPSRPARMQSDAILVHIASCDNLIIVLECEIYTGSVGGWCTRNTPRVQLTCLITLIILSTHPCQLSYHITVTPWSLYIEAMVFEPQLPPTLYVPLTIIMYIRAGTISCFTSQYIVLLTRKYKRGIGGQRQRREVKELNTKL